MTLYILTYNNYFNRQLKKLDTVADYLPFLNLQIDNVSFNPNDGIATSQIVNKHEKGNYLICSEDNVSVSSRWFIIEANRTRQGQYNLQLKRDTLADNLDSIKDAPMFVEKAMLEDDDPMIVNDEGMQTNKVKIRETLLKDETNIPWIVGYCSKTLDSTKTEINYTPESALENAVTLSTIAKAIGIDEPTLASAIGIDGKESSGLLVTYKSSFRFGYHFSESAGINRNFKIWISPDLDWSYYKTYGDSEFKDEPLVVGTDMYKSDLLSALKESFASHKAALVNQMSENTGYKYYLGYTNDFKAALKKYQGALVSYLGNLYRISFSNDGQQNKIKQGPNGYSLFYAFKDIIDDITLPYGWRKYDNGQAVLDLFNYKYTIHMESVSDYSITTTIPSNRNVMGKEVYDMFCMPAEDILVEMDGLDYMMQGDLCQSIAQELKTAQGDNIYDIQLLPYCPIPSIVANKINLDPLTVNKDYQWISPTSATTRQYVKIYLSSELKWYEQNPGFADTPFYCYIDLPDFYSMSGVARISDVKSDQYDVPANSLNKVMDGRWMFIISDYGGDLQDLNEGDLSMTFTCTYTVVHCGIIFWCSSNSFKVNLDCNLSLEHSMKIDSNLCSYRLCSPNYQGSFEFNVAKNGGAVNGFRADCTYKPYNPYIRVYPNFSWLYGTDFEDGRGLICGGDFSLPQVTDAWANYQLQNKNYQNTFNREIQSLDYNNSLALRNQKIGMFTGALSDAAKGAGLGALLGKGLTSGVIGGAIGGVASLIGGIADTNTMVKQQREQRQLSLDKFSYQLGNIQALPYTISKVGTFDINSKVFPFLEFYDCTDEELEAFENKLKYESMTVMRIGTLEEFKKTDMSYIKGSLIRLDISDDSNLVNDIYSELYKGVYY